MDIETELKKIRMELGTETIPKPYGRPLKEAAIGRVKFTTALQNHYIKWLKIQAAETGVSVADVVDKAIAAYKHEKDMNR